MRLRRFSFDAALCAGAFVLIATGAGAQDVAAGRTKAQACAACHGADGNSVAGEFPILAGLTARYLYLQLMDYKEGRRKNPVMGPMATNLSKADMLDLAAFFAAQTPRPTNYKVDAQKVAAGKAKAAETLCTMCHLGGFAGQNEIPRAAGQHYQYTVTQLKDFKARTRTNDGGNMTSVAQTLSEQDIDNLAQYLTSLQ